MRARYTLVPLLALLASCSKHTGPSSNGANSGLDPQNSGGATQSTEPLTSTGPETPTSAVPVEARPTPSAYTPDPSPIDHSKFRKTLNEYHPKHGMIYARKGGGCVVYVRDGKQHPPGWFPEGTVVACPKSMLAAQWEHCPAPGTVYSTEQGDACICSPGAGDPPAPPYRMPCPSKP
ncbi:MAG: hypothetical protein R3B13_17805 [Polyangiaceae bacterium]